MLQHFAIPPDDYRLLPIQSGHINRSWRVKSSRPNHPDYFLQQLNTDIFPDPAAICANMRTVEELVEHSDTFLEIANLISTRRGKLFYRDDQNRCFRLQVFKTHLQAGEIPQSTDDIYRAGRAFGEFFEILNETEPTSYQTILPHFHSVKFRKQQLTNAVRTDRANRVGEAKALLQRADTLYEPARRIEQAGLPRRIAHNDTKFNNVLLAPEGLRACVVDLDTVQPGCVHFDYGDGIRTTCTGVAEDAPPDDQVPQRDRLEAWRSGYLERTGAVLTEKERTLLPYAGGTLAYLTGIRFLADFLNGDTYYQTCDKRQNYRRAAAQLALAERLFGFGWGSL